MEQGQSAERNWRTRGWVLVTLGLFLVIFMGAIAWNLVPTILTAGVETGGSTFTGDSGDAQLAIGIFALVIAFGALCLVNGIYMVATGRRSAALTGVMIGIFVILFGIGWAIKRNLIS